MGVRVTMLLNKKIILSLIFLLSFLLSCGATVETNISDEQTMTDSTWSAQDLKEVADYMVDSMSNSRRIPEYSDDFWMLAKNLKNNTDEHIDTRQIMEKIRTQCINYGLARFIDDQAVEESLKQLKLQQSDLYDSSHASEIGNLVGARMLLRGTISSIRKKDLRTDIIYYNITLQAVDIETTEIIWTDEKEIQRMTKKSVFR